MDSRLTGCGSRVKLGLQGLQGAALYPYTLHPFLISPEDPERWSLEPLFSGRPCRFRWRINLSTRIHVHSSLAKRDFFVNAVKMLTVALKAMRIGSLRTRRRPYVPGLWCMLVSRKTLILRILVRTRGRSVLYLRRSPPIWKVMLVPTSFQEPQQRC